MTKYVITCLNNFISHLSSDLTTLNLYSNRCGDQNKNVNVMHYLFTLVRMGKFQHIRHHFPVKGHSFLPNDIDFGVTERIMLSEYTHQKGGIQ